MHCHVWAYVGQMRVACHAALLRHFMPLPALFLVVLTMRAMASANVQYPGVTAYNNISTGMQTLNFLSGFTSNPGALPGIVSLSVAPRCNATVFARPSPTQGTPSHIFVGGLTDSYTSKVYSLSSFGLPQTYCEEMFTDTPNCYWNHQVHVLTVLCEWDARDMVRTQ